MSRAKTISFVGAGALASALAQLLHRHGYTIAEIISRPEPASRRRAAALAPRVAATSVTLRTARLDSDLLWLAVPDGAIADVAKQLAFEMKQARWFNKTARPEGVILSAAKDPYPTAKLSLAKLSPARRKRQRVVIHSSGALGSTVLAPLSEIGFHTGSAHPMMTFVGSPKSAVPAELNGVWFALEGRAEAVRAAKGIVRKLGAKSFLIEEGNKPLYHAFGAMLSPMLASELAAAGQLGLRAGIAEADLRRIMEPIVQRTVQNVLRQGAENSFSGPLARGDVATVAGHLKALKGSPEEALYRALAAYALKALPVKRADEMKKLLRPRGRRP